MQFSANRWFVFARGERAQVLICRRRSATWLAIQQAFDFVPVVQIPDTALNINRVVYHLDLMSCGAAFLTGRAATRTKHSRTQHTGSTRQKSEFSDGKVDRLQNATLTWPRPVGRGLL